MGIFVIVIVFGGVGCVVAVLVGGLAGLDVVGALETAGALVGGSFLPFAGLGEEADSTIAFIDGGRVGD